MFYAYDHFERRVKAFAGKKERDGYVAALVPNVDPLTPAQARSAMTDWLVNHRGFDGSDVARLTMRELVGMYGRHRPRFSRF